MRVLAPFVIRDMTKCTSCRNCERACAVMKVDVTVAVDVVNPIAKEDCERCHLCLEETVAPTCIASCSVKALRLVYPKTERETKNQLAALAIQSMKGI